MNHQKSREIVLATRLTDELLAALDALREAWRRDTQAIPRGLSCSESKAGEFVLVAAESAFATLPGACVIKGLGAIEMLGAAPEFEPGSSSKSLVLRDTGDGWRFSIKFVPPIVREKKHK